MKDKFSKEIKKGDIINITGLITSVIDFVNVAGQEMVSTDYGDFNPSLVEVITTET
jgi:hypothetical protein